MVTIFYCKDCKVYYDSDIKCYDCDKKLTRIDLSNITLPIEFKYKMIEDIFKSDIYFENHSCLIYEIIQSEKVSNFIEKVNHRFNYDNDEVNTQMNSLIKLLT